MPYLPNQLTGGSEFVATGSNLATSVNNNLLVCGLSIFNPANSQRNIIVFSIYALVSASNTGNSHISLITTDPSGTSGFTNILTPQSHNLGSSAKSIASVCCSPNSIQSGITGGTVLEPIPLSGNGTQELLTNGRTFILPPGVGLQVSMFIATAGNKWGCTGAWLE